MTSRIGTGSGVATAPQGRLLLRPSQQPNSIVLGVLGGPSDRLDRQDVVAPVPGPLISDRGRSGRPVGLHSRQWNQGRSGGAGRGMAGFTKA